MCSKEITLAKKQSEQEFSIKLAKAREQSTKELEAQKHLFT